LVGGWLDNAALLEPQLGADFFVDFNRSGVLGAPVEILQVKETNDAWHMVSNLDTPFKKKNLDRHITKYAA
jgi:hypothetical protein